MYTKEQSATNKKVEIRVTYENNYYDDILYTVVTIHGNNQNILDVCENKIYNVIICLNIYSMFPIIIVQKYERITDINKEIVKSTKSSLYSRLINMFIRRFIT